MKQMKQLKCHYHSSKECDFVAKGKDRDEAIRKLMDHTARQHPELLHDMTPDIQRFLVKKMHEKMS